MESGLQLQLLLPVFTDHAPATCIFSAMTRGYLEQEDDVYLLIAADDYDSEAWHLRPHSNVAGEHDELINAELFRSQIHDG